MLKEFLLFIKYPYTAGIIALIWLSSSALIAIHSDLPLIKIVILNMIATVLIAGFGFRGKKEL